MYRSLARIPLPAIVRLSALLALVLLPAGPGHADERCRDMGFAQRCPRLCSTLCSSDRDYYLAHIDFCLSNEANAKGGTDADAACQMPGKNEPNPLGQCLDEAQRNARSLEEKLGDVKNDSDLIQRLRERLKGVPDCAPDAPTLLKMFDCLENEGKLVATGMQALSERGYSTLTEPDELCAIKREVISKDYDLARGLSAQAQRLQDAFKRIDACRDDYVEWAGSPGEDRARPGYSGALLGRWIEKIAEDLRPAEEMAKNLDNQLNKVETEMISITENIELGMVICE